MIGKPNVFSSKVATSGDEVLSVLETQCHFVVLYKEFGSVYWKSAFRDAFRGRYFERLGYLEKKRKRDANEAKHVKQCHFVFQV